MPGPDGGESGDPTTLVAVVAHGLLSAASNARGMVTTLRLHWDTLEPDRRDSLLERAEHHLAFVCESLLDLARGLPAELTDALHGGDGTPADPTGDEHEGRETHRSPQVGPGPAD
ncbi:MAG TPA: hypothetical protein VHN98_02475 [Acidimicrobiales bacterium]|nr:hypothetical protein [Acidimicrobiales bacterium]